MRVGSDRAGVPWNNGGMISAVSHETKSTANKIKLCNIVFKALISKVY